MIGAVAAALFAAAVVAFITTPVVRSLAFKVGAVDVPRDNRRMHKHPIPRMGGLAIFFGFILSALIFIPLTTEIIITWSFFKISSITEFSITI